MNSALPPAVIFIVGALFVPLFKGRLKQIYLLALPMLAGLDLLYLPNGQSWATSFLEYSLIFCRVDRLSLAFGYVFVLISFIATICSLHVKDDVQSVAALAYTGGALGVTFAGYLFSLYICRQLPHQGHIF